MTSLAEMTKRVQAVGTVSDDVPDLFRRNGSRFRGIASFGDGSGGKRASGPCVLLEVADTPESRSRGLMGRTSVPSCCGMLFTGLSGGYFWMKGCRIPLDIAFVKDGRVTKCLTMAADGGVRRHAYGDETEAIELQAGFCKRHGIAPGTPCAWRTW